MSEPGAVALAAVALAVPSQASARPAPLDPPPDTPASAHIPATCGRADQQFWSQATWLKPLCGLNLDRTPATPLTSDIPKTAVPRVRRVFATAAITRLAHP